MKFSELHGKSNAYMQIMMPIILGIACFALVCGFNVINPINEQWLFGGGDATQHYLGWLFYRNSPWAWPPGLNLSYGIGLNNSIVFTDSIPLLAIPFKALSPVLPSTFQYFGAWALLCFVLQSWFAWKLISLFTNNSLICALCTSLFIFTVPLLSLFPENPALGSLFLILAAFHLSLKQYLNYPRWSWFLLLLTASLIHFYIFVLVGVIWIGALLDSLLINKSISIKGALTSFLLSVPSVLIAAYLAGYFTISTVGAFGYGIFKINLLGLLNPAGWSAFVSTIYTKPHWWGEEPIYIGLGGLILLITAIIKLRQGRHLLDQSLKAHLFFVLVILILAIFSISNNIAIGPHEFNIPISERLSSFASILRNSGRMFIPAFYLLLLVACFLVIKLYSKKGAFTILGICLALQIIDLSPGWIDVRERMTSKGPFPLSQLPLKDPFWSEASKKYQNIIVIPSRTNLQPDFMSRFLSNDWRVFGRLASMNHMGTNAVYLARYDEPKSLALNQRYIAQLNTYGLPVDNLYVIDPDEVNTAACSNLRSTKNLLTKIDGYFILAPNYLDPEQINKEFKFERVEPKTSQINSQSVPYGLCGDWSKSEGWGTWSDGELAKIYIPIANPSAKRIDLMLQAFVNGKHPDQRIEISTDGINYRQLSLTQFSGNLITIPIDAKMQKGHYALLEFKLLNPVSPKSLGIGDDARKLGIGITQVNIR